MGGGRLWEVVAGRWSLMGGGCLWEVVAYGRWSLMGGGHLWDGRWFYRVVQLYKEKGHSCKPDPVPHHRVSL